jgi:hypothetical protein
MAGCGALSAVSGIPGSNHGRQRRNRPGPCRRFRRRPTPAARWPRRADTDRTARPPSRNRQPRCVSADRSTRPVAGHHGGRVRRSAAVAAGRCAAWVRTPTGDATWVAGTCCPQRGQRTGRRPLAERLAAMPVEAAAEGPQRFHPDGGNGTGWRTPDRSRVASCLDTLSAHRTTWPPTGQAAGSRGRSIR